MVNISLRVLSRPDPGERAVGGGGPSDTPTLPPLGPPLESHARRGTKYSSLAAASLHRPPRPSRSLLPDSPPQPPPLPPPTPLSLCPPSLSSFQPLSSPLLPSPTHPAPRRPLLPPPER